MYSSGSLTALGRDLLTEESLQMSQVLCDLAVDQDSPGVVSSGDVSFSVGIVLLDLSIRTVLYQIRN